MKKFLLSLVTLMAIGVSAWADDAVSVSAVEVRQGKPGVAQIYLNVDKSVDYLSFQLDVQLPNGVTCDEMNFRQKVDDGYIDATGPKGVGGAAISGENNFDVNSSYVSKEQPQQLRFLSFGMGKSINYGENGSFHILDIPFNVDASIAAGETLTGKVTGIHFTVDTSEGTKDIPLPDVSFDIKVVEDVLILDENSTTLPEIAENQNVLVKRTVNAGEWGTICLPFAMTASQVTEVFGEGTSIAYFVDYTIDDDSPASTAPSSEATSISVNFETDTFIEANMPCLIKPKNSVTEFTLTGVDVNPNGDNLYEYKNGRKVCGTFYGTMKAGETIPENGLFLSGGKFYYSKGATQIKGFRGYFVLNDVLASLASSGVKMAINVDGQTTRVSDLNIVDSNGAIYTIDGKKMNNDVTRLPKGVYLINGKKVAVK
ncbi:MAG: hypothetical protein IJK15_05330 [Bacteroidaceae bacterium]|nr:hypothetical protein [Bacteroidaceae bacterium]